MDAVLIRRKRASAEDLYKSCRAGGDCIPDVQNKYENKTWADKLLQWFGSIIYLGNLGIGSGKGSGGATGYRPIEGVGGPTRIPETTIQRPTVALDPLGGVDIVDAGIIDAGQPSIIPLAEGGGNIDPSVIDTLPAPDMPTVPPDVVTTFDPNEVFPSAADHPAIIATEEIALVDLQPGPPPPKRIVLDVGFGTDTNVQLNVPPSSSYYDSDLNIFVDPNTTGDTIGWEDIPLQDINEPAEATPKTSTPISQTFRTLSNRARQLYNRYTAQVRTENIDFLGRPERAVTFQIDNPAFSADVTREFQAGLDELAAAPDPDFQDIATLGRLQLNSTAEGRVRASRIGQRLSMQTRSGLRIGQKVHFFYDISDISLADEIELPVLAETSHQETFVDHMLESSFINANDQPNVRYSDEDLLDPLQEDFSSSQLLLQTTERYGNIFTIPTTISTSVKVFLPLPDTGLLVFHPSSTSPTNIVDDGEIPIGPADIPIADIFVQGQDYTIDPYILRRRRKRKYSEI